MATKQNRAINRTKSRRQEAKAEPRQKKRAGSSAFGRFLSDHLDSCLDSLGRFIQAPLQSLMTLLVIAVALSLPAMLYLIVKSVDTSISDIQKTADISVYFMPSTPEQDSLEIQASILTMPGVNAARFLSPDQALKEFQAYSGLGETLLYLDDNPLPATLLVTPEVGFSGLQSLLEDIGALDSVDQVEFDYLWLQRLESLLAIVERAVLVLGALLGLGVILILGNTIRLEIENRRDEVIVVKLVGGTDAFVRRPLLYTGIWYGLLGALVAWFISNFFAYLMSTPLQTLSDLYLSDTHLGSLDSKDLLMMLAIGITLGLAGAWLAAARHLSEIEPV